MKKTTKLLLATATAGFGLFCQHANATFLNGEIDFKGYGVLGDNGTFTSVSFTSSTSTINEQQTVLDSNVTGGGDNYSILAPYGQTVDFNPIAFTDSTKALMSPIAPTALWSIQTSNDFDFYLTSLTSVVYNSSSPSGGVTLIGAGYVTGTGFTNTNATYTLEGSYLGQVGSTIYYSFSVLDSTTSQGSGVPDGGATMALLGISLVGVEAIRRALAGRKAKVS